MNHIYRIVWNTATACYQAVTESAKGQSKGQRNGAVVQGNSQVTPNTTGWALTATALGAALCLLSSPGFAGPAGGQVTAGSATITQAGSATTINQTSNRAAIDWTKFSVGANESVRFNQPSASALTLNRVTGTESSAIMGSLSANGQVFILNPNGVLFGAGAQVNVGGLVASTLQINNANFMAGNYKFAGDATGSVVNHGHITVAPGGTLALMAPIVQNTGTLSAPGGSVLLAGAQAVTLTLQSNGGLVAYTLDAGSAQALVDNGGLIQAGGGHVVLTAKGVDALSKAVVNHSGVIEAQTVASKNGVIELLGDMQSGTVNVSGKLDASAPNADGKGGDGGFIDTSAANVKIADTTRVTTAAAAGQTGMWLIDPTDFTINAGGGSLPPSSGIAASTLNASLSITNATIATSAAGTGNGDIFVNSAVDWSANKLTLTAHRNININANLNASGTAKLALNYGQASADGAGSDYILASGAQVNLPAGQNFSTKQGSASTIKNYTVITTLGAEGSVTGADLQGMNGDINRNYVLGADIDATSTAAWGGGAGFRPITHTGYGATNRYPYGYAGDFDGMNHTISNLSIDKTKITTDRTDPSYYNRLGLFETLSGSVKNVTLESINYNNPGFNASGAGGIAGYNHGTISNVAVSGLITASGGGIVGTNSTDTVSPNPRLLGSNGGITNARSTVTIVGDSAGGIALSNWGSIKNSNYVGNLISTSYQGARIGGIFVDGNGSVDGSFSAGTITGAFVATYGSYGAGIAAIAGAGQISNSYSTMKISGFNFTAGISFSGGGNVKNSYFAGELTYVPMVINGVDYGRVYGLSRDLPVVSSYWNTQTAGDGVVQGGTGTGKTTAQMQQQSTYAGWDFVNTWVMLPGNSYPTLRNNPVRVAVVTPDPAIEAARLAAIASAAAAAAAEVDRLAAIETARVAELARQAAIVAEQARLAEVLRLARAATAAEADRLAAREAARVADIALLPEVARLAGSAAEQAPLGLAEVIRLAREAAAAEAARVAAAQAAQMTTAIGYLTNIVGVVTIIRANGNRVQVGNVPEAIPMWLGDIVDATRGADSVTVTFNDGSLLQLFAGQAVELAPLQPIIGSQLQQTLAESILNDRRLWSRVLGGSGVNLGGDGIVAGVRG